MLEVGVGHDDHVVLAAGICRDALVVRAALTVDILADMRRPDEADRGDFRVPQARVDDFLIAVDRVPNPIRQPRITPQLAKTPRRAEMIGRAHVYTQVTNEHRVCRRLLET